LAEQAQCQIRYVIGRSMLSLADAALAKVQAALEPAVFAEAFTVGQRMTLAKAFTTLLASDHVECERVNTPGIHLETTSNSTLASSSGTVIIAS
jgi:hypothetical protein